MGRTALWWAAVQGDEEVVKLLLEMGKADVNAADSDGATPLWHLRNLSLPLLFTLQSHTASGFLFTNTSHGTLRSVFLRLISAAASDNFDFDHVKPLLKSALAIEPDTLTGIEPMTLSPNPPRLPDR
ncbi:hypothetical protein BFJ67_g17179 [Fusarium oxysporum f. sp. cepae]|nr:hypothetical protein BFJ67_g17179 [Fusarium oxysporum f. sp. cepae]